MSLISGIGLVGVFIAWLVFRDSVLAALPGDIAVALLLHGIAWLVLIGGISLIATAPARLSFKAGAATEENIT